ncbi:hypothetical protein [Pseudomonas guariconensis]|uniref:hypothetical protein n=1 Tax=Pseudomonas guariconensis TaxID=1288410 RepID=UPI0018ABBEDA|nr:hypothetical protein [Pseudomonas guariconensis]MBF8720180.1 hypothetical protein [Pseudomonas guariconensis]
MRYNTGNPVEPYGSSDFRDAFDNTGNLDLAMNGQALTWVDRAGKEKKSWKGIQQQVTDYLIKSGYESVYLTYGSGVIVERQTQLVQRDGELYRVMNASDIPLTLTGTWATDAPKLQAVGDQGLRQQISGNLEAGWYTPQDLILDGVTDQTSKVLSAFSVWPRVRLPKGTIKLNLTIPDDCSLFGAGEMTWNVGASQWDGNGTLVIGSVRFDNRRRVTAGMMSIDNYAAGGNAVTGVGPNTRYIYVSRVNTRANNHGHLWEQNGTDPLGAAGGDVVLMDCNHHGGPNGFAVKMRGVHLERCNASLTTVQGFAIVSDNINGAGIYSRASNVRMVDCGGGGNNNTLHVYTRDHFSTTNANGVRPASDIVWLRGELSGCSTHGALIGDYYESPATRTQINCSDVRILFAKIILNTQRGVLITLGDRITVKYCTMGQNGENRNISFDDFGTRVTALDVNKNNTYGPALGIESGVIKIAAGAGSINASHGAAVYRTQNTVQTTISAFSGGVPGQSLTLCIDDDFTVCTVGGVAARGKGNRLKYVYDSLASEWICVSTIPVYEVATAWASTLVMDFSNAGVTSRYVQLAGTTALVQLASPAASLAGRTFTLRLAADAFAKAITAWSAVYKFSTAVPAPTSVPANTTTLVTFYWNGSAMVATSVVNYAT